MKIAFLILFAVLLASQVPNKVRDPSYPTEDSEWGTCWKADIIQNDAYVSGKAGDDDDSDGSNNFDTHECGYGFDNSCRTIKYTLCKFAQNITSGQTFTAHLEGSPFFNEQKLNFSRVGRKFIIDGELGRSFIKHNDSVEIQFIYVNGSEVSFTSCYIQQEEKKETDQSRTIKQYKLYLEHQVFLMLESDVTKADLSHLRFQGVQLRGENSSCLSVDVSKTLQFNISFSNFYDVQINDSITSPVLAAPIYIYFGTSTQNYKQNKEEFEEEQRRINMIQNNKVKNANGFVAIQDIGISNCVGSQTGGILFDGHSKVNDFYIHGATFVTNKATVTIATQFGSSTSTMDNLSMNTESDFKVHLADNLYVSKKGNDATGNGTSKFPYALINTALKHTSPNAQRSNPPIIKITDGEYPSQYIFHEKGSVIIRGSQSNKVNLTNADDNFFGLLEIKGDMRLENMCLLRGNEEQDQETAPQQSDGSAKQEWPFISVVGTQEDFGIIGEATIERTIFQDLQTEKYPVIVVNVFDSCVVIDSKFTNLRTVNLGASVYGASIAEESSIQTLKEKSGLEDVALISVSTVTFICAFLGPDLEMTRCSFDNCSSQSAKYGYLNSSHLDDNDKQEYKRSIIPFLRHIQVISQMNFEVCFSIHGEIVHCGGRQT
ncbi:MAG: hypothetical protein EZS28_004404 [Streblomastix strix]|uniref:Uncharacterized protein n=1 Tax=Streblomastix strix TaxID=222440 RepID=A0A5J4WZV3_9EUKA|nr:MAG: hypothetical protein EZS28_004404 [Streblomastix strix]